MEYYNIYNTNTIVDKVKIEGNIILSSIAKSYGEGSIEFKSKKSEIDNILSLLILVNTFDNINEVNNIDIFNNAINFISTGLLSPLTLSDDEFKADDTNDFYTVYENKRYHHILKYISIDTNIITYHNTKAFIPIIKAMYNHNSKEQISLPNYYIKLYSPDLYITKGGVTTGEQITRRNTFIDLDKPFDYLTKPIELPVSIIEDGVHEFHTIDHREPKLKEFLSLYNTKIDINSDIKGYYDIRKYTKLNKPI